jgi:epoxyqueuosine reductase
LVNAAATDDLRAALIEQARAEGFVAVGIAPAATDALRSERLQHYLDEQRHGSMEWMARRVVERASPQGLWPEAKSVIALGMSYAPAGDPLALADAPDRARISVYAQGRDYHDTVKKALKRLARWLVEQAPGEQVKVFVDTAPVMEKPLGAAAGLGWQGKHTNLVSREHGSWLFLGAIYTTIDFAPDEAHADRCGTCTACQDACPTGAFPAPFQIDARRCISYLTIEHAGPIPEEFRKAMGNRIYGCDDCLAVCPWNSFANAAAANKAFLPRAELAAPRLAELLTLDDAGFRALFSGSPIKRIGRNRFVRNCLIAAGNSEDGALVSKVQPLLADPDPVVAEAAQWAFEQLARLG